MIGKIIACDFDGTIAEKANYPEIGPPIFEVIEALKWEKKKGTKLILWTCRGGRNLDAAVEFCKEHGLEFDSINCDNLSESQKVYANEYWDDKCVHVDDIKIRGQRAL